MTTEHFDTSTKAKATRRRGSAPAAALADCLRADLAGGTAFLPRARRERLLGMIDAVLARKE